jgi:hypothetical protein
MATFREMMDRLNDRLKQFNQDLRIADYSRSSIILSNGQIIAGKENQKIKNRLLSPYSSLWVENFDKLIAGEITESEIKHQFAKIRGQNCQKIHGEKIKSNLNTGVPWIKGKGHLFKGRTHSPETKAKISMKNSGPNNGFYGRQHSQEIKDAHSKYIKELILSGKFTPNSNNRNTHWETTFNGQKYRSSWEALYHYYHPQAKYEELRISYLWANESKVYVVDFIDHVSKLVIEVKPRELCHGEKFKAKWIALQQWAQANSYKSLLVDKEWFMQNTVCPNLSLFDEKTARKIGQLYEAREKNRDSKTI